MLCSLSLIYLFVSLFIYCICFCYYLIFVYYWAQDLIAKGLAQFGPEPIRFFHLAHKQSKLPGPAAKPKNARPTRSWPFSLLLSHAQISSVFFLSFAL